MDILTRIKTLAESRNISLAELERRTGLSSGSITKWNKSSPSIDKIKIIADFFNVTTDDLIGRETPKETEASPEFAMIQRKARRLSQEKQQRLLKIMEATFEDIDNKILVEDDNDDL